MRKDAFYFPHDSNAKDDPKIVLLIEQLGLEGYGIYWVLVETLRDQPDYKYPLNLLPAIARRYATTKDKVEVVVMNYHLFSVTDDGLFFLSESLCRRMDQYELNRQKRAIAGKIGRQKQLENQHVMGNRRANAEQSPGNAGLREEKRREEKILKEEKHYVGQDHPTPCAADVKIETETPSEPQEKPDHIPYQKIIAHLNERCGCGFKPTSQATKRHIKARWNEGFRFDDFKAVIDSKREEWAQDAKMCVFLRPETLFSTKFEGYLQAARNGPAQMNGREVVSDKDLKIRIYDQKINEFLKGENPFIFAEREGLDELRRIQAIASEAAAMSNQTNA